MLLRKIISDSKLEREMKNILVKELFSISQEDRVKNPDINITDKEAERFKNVEKKILDGLAFQYAIGQVFFFGRKFLINENVLIPCPETEILVDLAIKFIKNSELKTAKILDIGTGSGIIPITIYKECRNAKLTISASDISKDALEVAKNNFRYHNVETRIIESDLFEKIDGKFELITANLPYGGNCDPDYKNLPHPNISIIGGTTGFEIIAKCLRRLDAYLSENGKAFFEIGYDQKPAIDIIAKELKQFDFTIHKDLNKYDRILVVSWKAPR